MDRTSFQHRLGFATDVELALSHAVRRSRGTGVAARRRDLTRAGLLDAHQGVAFLAG